MVKKRLNTNKNHSIVFLDIDNFSKVNEFYGHGMGTRVINALAKAINEVSKKHGRVPTRYGGEEFVLYFSEKKLNPSKVARELDRTFRKNVKKDKRLYQLIQKKSGKIPTFSIGFSKLKFGANEKNKIAQGKGEKSWLSLSKEKRNKILTEKYSQLMDKADTLMKQRAKKQLDKNCIVFRENGRLKFMKIRK